MEVEELERHLLDNPDLLEVLGGLNRIKKELAPNISLDEHLKEKKAQIREKIMQQKDMLTDEPYEDRAEYIIELMKLARRKIELDAITAKEVNDQEVSDFIEEVSTE